LDAAVRMVDIVKRYPGVVSNDHINLEVTKGEVHALLGENGAGKTTLMNILYGLSQLDSGEIFVNGNHVHIKHPADALANGISMIHQHFMLVQVFSVTENIALAVHASQKPVMDLESMKKKVIELADGMGLKIDPDARVDQLSVGTQQRVEIIKAIYQGAKVLIMDEPTSVLTPQEADELFIFLRRFTEAGNSVIFITHKLREVLAVSDRVTVLRDGKVVGTAKTKEINLDTLAMMMVGRKLFLSLDRPTVNKGKVLLDIKDVHTMSSRGTPALRGLSLQVCSGEVLGVAGVDGNGQNELAEVIMGLRSVTQGDIHVKGISIIHKKNEEIIHMGVSSIPFNRQEEGLVLTFPISDNLLLKERRNQPFNKSGFLDYGTIRKNAEQRIKEYDIRATGPEAKAGNMSGGNQQKLVLARELSRQPDILIACHPTHGLDIGATEYVRQQLIMQRSKGIAVLLFSTELEEILSVCDRFVVLYEGQIMGELKNENVNVEEIGKMMLGVRQEAIRSEKKKAVSAQGVAR